MNSHILNKLVAMPYSEDDTFSDIVIFGVLTAEVRLRKTNA